jgi:hypothetical protein
LQCPLYPQKRTFGDKFTCPLWANSGHGDPLLDHLVGAGEQRGWDGDAEHLRSLEVDDEFELGGELNWQMGDGGCL